MSVELEDLTESQRRGPKASEMLGIISGSSLTFGRADILNVKYLDENNKEIEVQFASKRNGAEKLRDLILASRTGR